MATAHLIHGYIGVGKTTFARRLEQELPAIRFTHDEWMSRLYGDDPPPEAFPDYFSRVSELIGTLWPRCLELGIHVVLDLGFWTHQQRDEVRGKVLALGGMARLYRLSCSDEVAWSRVSRRNLSLHENLFISRNTFEVLRAKFEPLDPSEDHIEVVT